MDKYFLFCSSLRIPCTLQISSIPLCLLQLHQPHTPQPAAHLFMLKIKVVSSLFVTANGRISLSLCCIFPCNQSLEHYKVSLVHSFLHCSPLNKHMQRKLIHVTDEFHLLSCTRTICESKVDYKL